MPLTFIEFCCVPRSTHGQNFVFYIFSRTGSRRLSNLGRTKLFLHATAAFPAAGVSRNGAVACTVDVEVKLYWLREPVMLNSRQTQCQQTTMIARRFDSVAVFCGTGDATGVST